MSYLSLSSSCHCDVSYSNNFPIEMEDIRSLSQDVKNFSCELKRLEQYLEKDIEPPGCDEAISQFR